MTRNLLFSATATALATALALSLVASGPANAGFACIQNPTTISRIDFSDGSVGGSIPVYPGDVFDVFSVEDGYAIGTINIGGVVVGATIAMRHLKRLTGPNATCEEPERRDEEDEYFYYPD